MSSFEVLAALNQLPGTGAVPAGCLRRSGGYAAAGNSQDLTIATDLIDTGAEAHCGWIPLIDKRTSPELEHE
ncbi:MAG: hypothetical protein Q7R22_005540 [Verrucomicrobiota bacterium JB025]|nr:hypothetical protein [Verrucomicrobiota bacterium JB025]